MQFFFNHTIHVHRVKKTDANEVQAAILDYEAQRWKYGVPPVGNANVAWEQQ
jgi:hypothetical protein